MAKPTRPPLAAPLSPAVQNKCTFWSINTINIMFIRLNQWWPWYCPFSSPVDLKSIPVNVPAATVLRSSSAPLAFSMATPNTLYKRAVEKERPTFYYARHNKTIILQLFTQQMWYSFAQAVWIKCISYPQILVCWPMMRLVVWPCSKFWT